jgi:alkyldihydroxyacetonephosphate synthase
VAGPWSALAGLADEVTVALRGLAGTLVASVHQSHAYPDGACLYFTFGGRGADPDDLGWQETYYRDAWDLLTRIVVRHSAAISHHHGIGLNRARFLSEALGPAHDILRAIKGALDPTGILNPGKFDLASPFGSVPWP